ncbi:MAG: glycosyltransferase, partial [Chloroflexota bacterium]
MNAAAGRPAASAGGISGQGALPVSVVVTVLNEEGTVGPLLESLLGQDRPPDEVVVVDGGSTDGTAAVVRRYGPPVRLVDLPGCNISAGRNRGIREARNEVVAVTDAGVRLDPDWLRLITVPLLAPDGRPPDVVAGFFVADPRTAFEVAMGATVLPVVEEVDPASFLPSSRSVAF